MKKTEIKLKKNPNKRNKHNINDSWNKAFRGNHIGGYFYFSSSSHHPFFSSPRSRNSLLINHVSCPHIVFFSMDDIYQDGMISHDVSINKKNEKQKTSAVHFYRGVMEVLSHLVFFFF